MKTPLFKFNDMWIETLIIDLGLRLELGCTGSQNWPKTLSVFYEPPHTPFWIQIPARLKRMTLNQGVSSQEDESLAFL